MSTPGPRRGEKNPARTWVSFLAEHRSSGLCHAFLPARLARGGTVNSCDASHSTRIQQAGLREKALLPPAWLPSLPLYCPMGPGAGRSSDAAASAVSSLRRIGVWRYMYGLRQVWATLDPGTAVVDQTSDASESSGWCATSDGERRSASGSSLVSRPPRPIKASEPAAYVRLQTSSRSRPGRHETNGISPSGRTTMEPRLR